MLLPKRTTSIIYRLMLHIFQKELHTSIGWQARLKLVAYQPIIPIFKFQHIIASHAISLQPHITSSSFKLILSSLFTFYFISTPLVTNLFLSLSQYHTIHTSLTLLASVQSIFIKLRLIQTMPNEELNIYSYNTHWTNSILIWVFTST